MFDILVFRKMQIKTTMRHNFTPIRLARIGKNKIETSTAENIEELELSYTAVRDVKRSSCFKKV